MKRRNFLSLSTLGLASASSTHAAPTSLSQWEGFYRVSNNTLQLKPQQLVDCVEALSALTHQPIHANGNQLSFTQNGQLRTLNVQLTL